MINIINYDEEFVHSKLDTTLAYINKFLELACNLLKLLVELVKS